MMKIYEAMFKAWQKPGFRALFWGGVILLPLLGLMGGVFLFLEIKEGKSLLENGFSKGILGVLWLSGVGIWFFFNYCRKKFKFLDQWRKEVESGLNFYGITGSFDLQEKLEGREKLWDRVYQAYFEEKFQEWGFTKAEIEVSVLMLTGMSQEEIAACRKTSLKTVKNQATVIYEKAQVKNGREFLSHFLLMLLPHLKKVSEEAA